MDLIIENGYNTSYLSTLLMALFFKSSHLEHLFLETEPKSAEYIYMQELIKSYFVETVHNKQSISSEKINSIRNYLFILGFRQVKDILSEHDIMTLYEYIVDKFNIEMIETNNTNIDNINFSSPIQKLCYVEIELYKLIDPSAITTNILSLKNLVEKWFEVNSTLVKCY